MRSKKFVNKQRKTIFEQNAKSNHAIIELYRFIFKKLFCHFIA
jgi:hypothetical protein